MIVVSDASPIICLSAVGRLDLLRQLYDEVWIPTSVQEEIDRGGPGQPGVTELRSADWIFAKPAQDEILMRALDGELDRGEAEAIALAQELKADLLLIDERRGRAVASRLGLKAVGILGVLMEGKRRGLLPAVAPLLIDLRTKAAFRISPQLYNYVLETAGEREP